MMRWLRRSAGWLLLALALLAGGAAGAGAGSGQGVLLIRSARVFDGTGAPARRADVLVRDGRIVAVGPRLRAPGGAHVVEARGRTLLPGLHDLHTHLRSPGHSGPEDLGKAWAGHLLRGVTTVNDYSVSAEMLAPIRAMTRQPGGVWAPHLNLAIRTGVPGGHGTEYGWGGFFTLTAATPRAAHLAMARALPYRPDAIKVFADGWRYGRGSDLNSMDVTTLAAIVADARAAGVPVVTHTVTLDGAKVAGAAGVTAIVHGIGDAPVDDRAIALMRAGGTAYVPTMMVYQPRTLRTLSAAERAVLTPPELAREERLLAAPGDPPAEATLRRWQVLEENLRRMRGAGIAVGIGTDAGIGGVYHGSSAIREIIALTRTGYSPAEALLAATATSAAIMGQAGDHGTIAPGMRADLVLIDGRPDERIEDLWAVARVWLAGRAVPLDALRALVDSRQMSPLPVHRMAGPIHSGARSDGRTDLGTLPVDASEAGADHSDLAFVHRPEPGGGGDGAIVSLASFGANPRPFAQLVLPLTPGGVAVADARGFTGIAFVARGAGSYRLLIESYGLGAREGFAAPFAATPAGAELRLPFCAFASAGGDGPLDPARLRALRFELAGEPGGRAWLELADVRFY